jgi:hypothetical protein
MEDKFVKVQRVSSRVRIRDLHTYEVTEKLDGANFSFYVDENNELVCRSRNRELVDETGNFTRCVEYVKTIHVDIPFNSGYLYFGECMTKHTIHYGEAPTFVGFAVMDMETKEYTYDWVYHYHSRGVPYVEPCEVAGVDMSTYIESNLNRKSAFGDTDTIQEGLVLKCYETQEFIKFVRDQFKEDNRKAFGGKLAPEDDTGKIVLRFCTHARIEKHVYKIRDEKGMQVGFEMMQHLPKDVCDDIICEEFMTIYGKYTTMNFKQFRKLIAKECVQYFKSREMVV